MGSSPSPLGSSPSPVGLSPSPSPSPQNKDSSPTRVHCRTRVLHHCCDLGHESLVLFTSLLTTQAICKNIFSFIE